MSKQFHLGDILSITTGILVSPRLMSGVYDILNYMTGDDLFTHQLPRAAEECRPHLLRQFPQLMGVDKFSDKTEVASWLIKQIEKYGEFLEVETLTIGVHQLRDPIAEAGSMIGKEKVIVVGSEEKLN
jgi:hypothetical protein